MPYPYLDPVRGTVDVARMTAHLAAARAGDVVLLRGCCHNPSGADLTPADWIAVADLVAARGLVPFVDLAYQGFGDGLGWLTFGVRTLAARGAGHAGGHVLLEEFRHLPRPHRRRLRPRRHPGRRRGRP